MPGGLFLCVSYRIADKIDYSTQLKPSEVASLNGLKM